MRPFIALALAAGLSGCAALEQLRSLIQPPRFEQADGQRAEIRLLGPTATQPLGGAGIRLWTKVHNPNPFGLTIASLATTLLLDDERAATGDFPLGLPLGANQESVIPLDLTIDFADVPALAANLRRIASGQTIAYELEGTVGVDAGRLGQPQFGPMRLVSGELNRNAVAGVGGVR
jgi:hypothetical protein